MDKAENKTYYYPSSRGVTPADHDVAYWDEYQPDKETGGWRDWKAHLLIENPLPLRILLMNRRAWSSPTRLTLLRCMVMG